jgi:hypothetical protein
MTQVILFVHHHFFHVLIVVIPAVPPFFINSSFSIIYRLFINKIYCIDSTIHFLALYNVDCVSEICLKTGETKGESFH